MYVCMNTKQIAPDGIKKTNTKRRVKYYINSRKIDCNIAEMFSLFFIRTLGISFIGDISAIKQSGDLFGKLTVKNKNK